MSTISASTTSNTAFKVTSDTTGTLVLQTGAVPTTAISIDASQVVSIGSIAVTGVTTFSAGSAAAPSITTTGDTNTGIFFPAADTIAFTEGGVEAARIDSSGNLGIGTSSPQTIIQATGTSVGALLDVATVRNGSSTVSSEVGIFFNPSSQVTNVRGARISAINTGSNNIGLKFYTGTGATITSKMTLDYSGNLGIGVTPSAWSLLTGLQVKNACLAGYLNNSYLYANSYYDGSNNKYIASGFASYYEQSSGKHIWYNAASGSAGDTISFTQAMTLTAADDLLVGTTSSGVYGGVICRLEAVTSTASNGAATFKNATAGTQTVGVWNATDSGTRYFIEFSDGSTRATRGSITSNGTATAYNTTSDYRLKTVLGAVANAGQRIDALQPVEYTWNANGERARGFLAHQFQEVYANSVSGTKDAVDVEGNPVYQAMQASTSEVIADLVAELQSVRARLAALESK